MSRPSWMPWLEAAVAFERALLTVSAEWIARVPSLHDKIALCRWVWSAAERVRRQSQTLPHDRRAVAIDGGLDAGARALLAGLRDAPSARAFMGGLEAILAPAAAAAYTRAAGDGPRWAAASNRSAAVFYGAVARRVVRRRRRRAWEPDERAHLGRVERLTTCVRTLRPAPDRTVERCAPLMRPERDRAIRALRRGERRHEQWVVTSRRDEQQYLHQMIAFEIAAFEAVGRHVAEFPEMPWAFQRDMAVQVRDELSHLLLWTERLASRGGRLGAYALSALEFDACAGAGLSDRLALLQRLIEGGALEALDLNRALWESRGDPRMVACVVRVQRDEIRHVRQGNRWLRWLAGDEPTLRDTVARAEDAMRARLLEAARELEAAGVAAAGNTELMRLKLDEGRMLPVNPALRRCAGFSGREIESECARRALGACP